MANQNEASSSTEEICYIDLRTCSSSVNLEQSSNNLLVDNSLCENIILAIYAEDDELQQL